MEEAEMTARTWALRSLASAAILAVAVSAATAQAPAKVAAVVNGETITVADVEAVLKSRGPMATPPTELQRKQMQFEALSMLIDDLVMQQFLRQHAPKIDAAEASKRLAELEQGLKKQNKTLVDFYRETGQNEAQVRSNLISMLQWAAYVKDKVTDADVKRYYDENKEFFDQITVRASHIVIRVASTAPAAERDVAAAKLQALRQAIMAGKLDFGEAAKQNSQCPSAPNGGDIGYFPRKWVVEEPFARAAFALKVNDVSEVVQTDYGVHLIKVTDRKPGQPSDFNKIKDEVREICIEELRLSLVAQQRKASQVKIEMQ
jgi:peptidyl-prolyl cis-trans isomerase C